MVASTFLLACPFNTSPRSLCRGLVISITQVLRPAQLSIFPVLTWNHKTCFLCVSVWWSSKDQPSVLVRFVWVWFLDPGLIWTNNRPTNNIARRYSSAHTGLRETLLSWFGVVASSCWAVWKVTAVWLVGGQRAGGRFQSTHSYSERSMASVNVSEVGDTLSYRRMNREQSGTAGDEFCAGSSHPHTVAMNEVLLPSLRGSRMGSWRAMTQLTTIQLNTLTLLTLWYVV